MTTSRETAGVFMAYQDYYHSTGWKFYAHYIVFLGVLLVTVPGPESNPGQAVRTIPQVINGARVPPNKVT